MLKGLFQNFIKKNGVYTLVFILLWVYLFLRAVYVPLIHDEIFTKWSYMIDWNFLPYTGYLDANNHFTNSFLGGLFYRLFNSEANVVVRLGNLLAFPLAYWSLVGFAPFFKRKLYFIALLTTIFTPTLILEYFALARGYGISIAFLIFSILQLLLLFKNHKIKNSLWATLGAVFMVYSNLSMLPLGLIVLFFIGVHFLFQKKYTILLLPILALIPMVYATFYSFHLKENGRLYYGGTEGFFIDTVKSISDSFWNLYHPILNASLVVITLLILVALFLMLKNNFSIFKATNFIIIFFLLALTNIFAQHYILDVLWPIDRAVIYLPILFFMALTFVMDYYNIKPGAFIIIGISIYFFVANFNITHSKFFYYEHFDEALITKIPASIKGTPPTTGGRFWLMDNELMRRKDITTYAFQNSPNERDTLQDYIIITDVIRPEINGMYHPIYQDDISNLTLFERDSFLNRTKVFETTGNFNSNNEFIGFHEQAFAENMLLRITLNLINVDINNDYPLIIGTENSQTQEKDMYQGLDMLHSAYVSDNGELSLDISYVVHKSEIADFYKMYIWNKTGVNITGSFSFEAYSLE